MDKVVVITFLATYAGMALGRVPGLRLDRTGIAVLALVVLLAVGAVEPLRIGDAIHAPTLMLLFALMIISSQFQAAGLYRALAARVAAAAGTPDRLLALVVISAGMLSAVLANDIVVFAMTPIIAQGMAQRGVDARPYLMGLVGAANAGSAMTIIGNPQNILIGQLGELNFWAFLWVCGIPALAALAIVFAVVRDRWRAELARDPAPLRKDLAPPVDRWQAAKAVGGVVVLLVLFATSLPREVSALMVAGIMLLSRRMASRDMIGAVDWHLLLLFAALFVITDAFAATGLAQSGVAWLNAAGIGPDRLGVLGPLLLAGSNTIGNVPSVMLVLSNWPLGSDGSLYALALLSTLAGNFLLVGSMANIIAAESAANAGCRMGFRDFARAGIPMTLASMAVAMGWLWLGGWVGW